MQREAMSKLFGIVLVLVIEANESFYCVPLHISIWVCGMSSSRSLNMFLQGIGYLKKSLAVYIVGIVLGILGAIVVVGSMIQQAMHSRVIDFASLAWFVGLMSIFTMLYYFFAYRGFDRLCRCLEDFCFAKKVFLAMIFVAIITTAVACAWLSTLKIRLDHFEEEYARLKEIRNTMLVARIPFALFGLFVGFVFYTCMKKLRRVH